MSSYLKLYNLKLEVSFHEIFKKFATKFDKFWWNTDKYTVWKFQDFCITQILWKSLFENLEVLKSRFFAILGALKFLFW